jgi:hypothetical protein
MESGYEGVPRHRSTYETSLMVLVGHAIGSGRSGTVQRLARWLVERFDEGTGLWAYPDGQPDLSNTQLAVFALKAATERGFKVPPRIWMRLIDRVLRLQDRDGGFRYKDGVLASGSMTHAALLVLHFAQQALGRAAPRAKIRVAVRRAQAWFDSRYTVEHNPMGNGRAPGYFYYYLWGLERYGLFFGIDEIAGHDWYREGAEHLLGTQGREGAWGALHETGFAVLFLRKAGLTVAPRERGAAGVAAVEPPAAPAAPPRPGPDVPFLRAWLIAGPFASEPGQDDMLLTSHLNEKRLGPRPGDLAGRGRWVRHTASEDAVKPAAATREASFAAWYAFTWIEVSADLDAVIWLASDDGARLYLDGALIFEGHHHDGVPTDHYRVPLRLSEGRHRLLLKVENVGYDVWFKLRLSDPEGRAHPALHASPILGRRR